MGRDIDVSILSLLETSLCPRTIRIRRNFTYPGTRSTHHLAPRLARINQRTMAMLYRQCINLRLVDKIVDSNPRLPLEKVTYIDLAYVTWSQEWCVMCGDRILDHSVYKLLVMRLINKNLNRFGFFMVGSFKSLTDLEEIRINQAPGLTIIC